ncbi:1,2-diacylglycerol-3-alpha-glucose alpha-1,2-glucosyltransferase [Kineosphaera limosa]|uniref:glycosyltransferase family 4 protein n=1 Tax=Kineosphaera limosa TaxID=111564 RepID=UPI00146143DC|nr:glycosyltransferase family 4 protein [Kineosphaera limosa]NYE02194.1 1,2-diacylglycerol-3-alpha-glucose alpha-1,2-glucosyltransferase [Kineosphaera limosa]
MAKGSGVGSAMRHQAAMLRHGGARLVPPWAAPQVLQLNTVFPDSVLAGMVARLLGMRVVTYAHSTRQDFEESWVGSAALAPLLERWLALAYRVGHVVVTPTPYSRGIIEGYGLNAPIHVLTNGVDTTFFDGDPTARARFRARHGLGEGDRAVLSVGHLMVRKGIVEFIEVARSMPETRFFWAGSMPKAAMPPQVRLALEQAPPNLTLLGQLPPEGVRDAYAGADLFCFLSREETQGIVVLEALASGVPVLVRSIGAYEGWLTEGVVHTAPGSASTLDIARSARAILDGDAPDLVPAGRELARLHDVRAVSAELLDILGGAMAGVSRAGAPNDRWGKR